jgi:hypothetical protein
MPASVSSSVPCSQYRYTLTSRISKRATQIDLQPLSNRNPAIESTRTLIDIYERKNQNYKPNALLPASSVCSSIVAALLRQPPRL